MRVLIITTLFAPDIGGTARIMTDLAHDFRAEGHDVTVVTSHPHYFAGTAAAPAVQAKVLVEEVDGLRVVRMRTFLPRRRTILARAFSFVSYMFAASRAVRRLRLECDAVVAVCPPLTNGLSAYWVGKLRRVPYVYYIQDLYPETAIELGYIKNALLIRIARSMADFIHSRAGRIAVISNGFRDAVTARGIPDARVSIVPNWVDVERFDPRVDASVLRRTLALEGKFVVLFAGTIGLAQGIETVLPRAAELLKDEPGIAFVVLGGGLRKQAVEDECRARGLTSVRFLEPQPHEEMPLHLAAADAYLIHLRDIPLYRITIPSKTYECLAMGRPLLMGVEGEAAAVVERAGAGLSFRPGDPDALASAIRKLARDPDLCAQMGGRGRDYAAHYHSRRTITGAFIRETERLTAVPGEEVPV